MKIFSRGAGFQEGWRKWRVTDLFRVAFAGVRTTSSHLFWSPLLWRRIPPQASRQAFFLYLSPSPLFFYFSLPKA
jgi:hypothetical protein